MTRNGLVRAGLALAVLMAAPVVSEAGDGHGRRWRDHDHFDHGRGWGWRRRHSGGHNTVIVRPSSHVKIVFRGRPYYYGGGRFYEKRVHSYVGVAAPVGIMVQELPLYHRTVVIDGVTYHEYDGIYYKGGAAGYQVVSLPLAHSQSGPLQLASAPGAFGHDDRVTINVPNENGSYTPVELKEMNGLYIGPRGEVYNTKPSTDQLKIMYGQ